MFDLVQNNPSAQAFALFEGGQFKVDKVVAEMRG